MKSSEEMISGKGNELAYSADNIKFTELTDAKLATRLAFFIAGFGLACIVMSGSGGINRDACCRWHFC